MAQRANPFHGSAGGSAGTGPLPFDLDWELQRLLSEETAAMEPEAPGTKAVEATPAADERQEPAPIPAPVGAVDPAMQAQTDDLGRRLWGEIEELYQLLNNGVGARRLAFEEVSELLGRGRSALMRGPAGVSEAEKLVRQAQGLLQAREDSRRWSATYGAGILIYEFLFFLAFAAILAFDGPLASWAGIITRKAGAAAMRDILPFWDTMIWGGIGGVLGALYSLYWHVAEKQDFDRQFNMWYVVQPLMGGMLGAFVYLIVVSGLLAMRSDIAAAAHWFPSALACLCGFRQKFIFELLDKLMEVIGLRPLLQRSAKQ